MSLLSIVCLFYRSYVSFVHLIWLWKCSIFRGTCVLCLFCPSYVSFIDRMSLLSILCLFCPSYVCFVHRMSLLSILCLFYRSYVSLVHLFPQSIDSGAEEVENSFTGHTVENLFLKNTFSVLRKCVFTECVRV